MNKGNRKHVRLLVLTMSLAVVGMLAAFIALAAQPGPAAAQTDPLCDGPLGPLLPQCQGVTPTTTPTPGTTPTARPTTTPMAGDVKIESSSTSGSATVELKLTVKLKQVVPVGGAIVLYLEDDFQEPESISASDVYFVVDPANSRRSVVTGSGSRVYATQNPEIDTDDHFTADKDDIDIRVSLPDLCTSDTQACEGRDGLESGDTVTMVIQKSAGIKNPSEAGTHSVGASVLGPADNVGGPMYKDATIDNAPLSTLAKIGISDPDNSRGYEMTVTGSGFNNGTTAGVYVLAHARFEVAKWWETLDCAGMKAALGTDSDNACFHFDLNSTNMSYMLNTSDGTRGGSAAFKALSADNKKKYSDMVFTQHLCRTIIQDGTEVGGALVGTDDKVAVTFEVTAPTFKPGNVNYICMVDGEGRMSNTDVEDFNLEPSIRVSPSEVNSGDTVTVFAQDFKSGGFETLKLAGQQVYPTATGQLPMVRVSAARAIGADGSSTVNFEMPGGLKGTIRVDAAWGGVSEDAKITVAPSTVTASQTDVLPNDSITLTGNGFAGSSCVLASSITLDNVQMTLDDESNDNCGPSDADGVSTSNAGQFVATIHLAPAMTNASDPTLIAGSHTLDVEDDKGFTGSVTLDIAEPTITITPDVAGPRDYISVAGQNWPVDNPENPLEEAVTITVKDNTARGRMYSAFADTAGRFTVEHQVHRGVAIPSTIQVEVKYDDTIVKIATFDVPVATITVDPGEAQPGDTISISATNMPVYTDATSVKIGGSEIGNLNAHTDRDGNITVADVLVPGLDPGTYSVQLKVKDTVAIGELKVLAESAAGGAPAELPGAVENLGDSLVAIFHFDDVGKSWSFHDPRPEFAELNTLTQMSNGEAYWILVSETMDEVVLNNKVRSLTCRGDDCWNLEVW